MEPTDPQSWPIPIIVLEGGLLLAGLYAIYRCQFSSRASRLLALRLRPWEIPLSDALLSGFLVVFSGLVLQFIVMQLKKRHELLLTEDTWTVVLGAAFQLGMLVGVVMAWARSRTKVAEWEPDTPPPPPEPVEPPPPLNVNPVLAGAIVFVAALPLVYGVSLVWQTILQKFGRELEAQELVDLFLNPDSPVVVIALSALAITLAPVTEELVFRAGLFRYLRTRIPRKAAFFIPSILFSALHGSVVALAPLIVFGLVLSAAYERTGRLSVPIIAHGLFNLHTIALLLAGVK